VKKPPLNEDVRDAYIGHAVNLQRVGGDVAQKVDAAIVKLGEDLATLILKIDPTALPSVRGKEARQKKLEIEGARLIKERMIEVYRLMNLELKDVAELEAVFVDDLLRRKLNGDASQEI
jgi:hypothetical protein